MNMESVRRMDDLGRIIVPIEMRQELGWDHETKISITCQGEQLILQACQGKCIVCGGEENIRNILGKCICQKCIDDMNVT